MKRKLLSLLLSLALVTGLTAPALAAETAAVIRLTKTTGTVEISKSSGKPISLLANMRLYNGYHVETAEESYAWINLDDSKLLKEDAASEIEVRKDGKKLEVQLCSGNVFFDVAEPLEDDESLNIRTSTMIVGVRGTSGWIQVVDRWRTMVSVLEGTVECTVTDPITGQLKSAEIEGGETAECVVYPREQVQQRCDILMKKYPIAEIPGFVLTDLTRDMKLCDKIEAMTGLDIPRDLASVAGGDPSGRTPDRENATPEVLGEADRREDEDEEELHDRIEEIEKELEKQPDNISPSKPIEKPAPAPETPDRDSGSSSGDSGTTTPDPTPTPPQTHGMKLTDVEVQALLDAASSVSIEPNTDAADATPKKNTLEVDTGLTVAAGKTLDLQSGIDVEVYPGKTLQVDGTLAADALQNDGTTVVTSGNTLRVRGDLNTAGTMNVTDTGRVVVDGTFTRTGTLTLASGATVLAKTFAPGAAPEGWEVSAEADASGYYRLTPSGGDEPAPAIYQVTFNANGGLADGANSAVVMTDGSGKPVSWPTPTYGDPDYAVNVFEVIDDHVSSESVPRSGDNALEFDGWYDAPVGGNPIPAGSAFTEDTTLYAHWKGWFIDSGTKTLIIAGSGEMEEYGIITYGIYEGSGVYNPVSAAPWTCSVYSGAVENVELREGLTSICNWAFYGYGTNGAIRSITIPSSVTSIGEEAFDSCRGLTSVEIPSSVTGIGDGAFGGCTSLKNVTIPSGVTTIEANTFRGCSSLTSVEIPSSVTSIGDGAFGGCTSLTSVEIPSGVTSIGDYAFRFCRNLTSVMIPPSVTSIGDAAFQGCSGLTSVEIPSGVISIGREAFDNCASLTKVTIPSSVTTIGDYAFFSCTDLTEAIIPSSVTSIGVSAFNGCASLKNVTIPSGVTTIEMGTFAGSGLIEATILSGVTTIKQDAFENCASLTKVTIPSSVTSIESYAFEKCTKLTSIEFGGTQDEWNNISIEPGAIPGGVTIKDKDGSLIT